MAIYQDNRDLLRRLRWLRALMALVFFGLVAKLWFLAVLHSNQYQELAERNRVRTIPLLAPRGQILDRGSQVLADSILSFNLLLFRDEAEDLERTVEYLIDASLIGRDVLEERMRTAESYLLHQPVVIREDLSMDEIAYLMAHQAEHPELRIFEQPRRRYRHGEVLSHVLGYVGEISSKQLESEEFSQNRAGDLIGKYGIERQYNRHLTGSDGYRRVQVNSLGKALKETERIEATPGRELKLTIDLDLQLAAEEGLGENPGAVVALDPRTGDILALASKPSFDPNLFAARLSLAEWEALIENPDDPLQNRVIQSAFSPGSTFKIVMALAGLERGVIDSKSRVYCNGGVRLYGHRFRCWKAGGHGWVTLRDSIQQSCNVYFYLLGKKLGIDQIEHFSRKVGLGIATGLGLRGEVSGLVPSDRWKRQALGQPWYAGETISVSIGQGPLNVTPVQMARAIGIVATGLSPELRLVLDQEHSHSASDVSFSSSHAEVIREAMWSVVNEWGTGRAAQVEGFEVCGKTGTVQTISNARKARLSKEEQARFEPDAWFIGFAPFEEAEIVVAVMVQHGGSGSRSAAPIAGKLFETYYKKHKQEINPSATGLELAQGQTRRQRM